MVKTVTLYEYFKHCAAALHLCKLSEQIYAHCFIALGTAAVMLPAILWLYLFFVSYCSVGLHSDHKDDGANGATCSTENSLFLPFLIHVFVAHLILVDYNGLLYMFL